MILNYRISCTPKRDHTFDVIKYKEQLNNNGIIFARTLHSSWKVINEEVLVLLGLQAILPQLNSVLSIKC